MCTVYTRMCVCDMVCVGLHMCAHMCVGKILAGLGCRMLSSERHLQSTPRPALQSFSFQPHSQRSPGLLHPLRGRGESSRKPNQEGSSGEEAASCTPGPCAFCSFLARAGPGPGAPGLWAGYAGCAHWDAASRTCRGPDCLTPAC